MPDFQVFAAGPHCLSPEGASLGCRERLKIKPRQAQYTKWRSSARHQRSTAAEGKLKDRFEVVEGLDNAPAALRRLFDGSNTGKQLVKVREP